MRLGNTALDIYHCDFRCHCQTNPNGLISHEPNKTFPANSKQEEDFLFVKFNSLVVDFSSCRTGEDQNVRVERTFLHS